SRSLRIPIDRFLSRQSLAHQIKKICKLPRTASASIADKPTPPCYGKPASFQIPGPTFRSRSWRYAHRLPGRKANQSPWSPRSTPVAAFSAPHPETSSQTASDTRRSMDSRRSQRSQRSCSLLRWYWPHPLWPAAPPSEYLESPSFAVPSPSNSTLVRLKELRVDLRMFSECPTSN